VSTPYVLTESAWNALKADHDRLRLMVSQMSAGMRRHQGVVMPDFIWLGKADSSIAGGATGTVSIWNGEPGSEADSGDNKENCYNRSTSTINADDWCLVREIRRRRYVLPLPTTSTRNVVMWAGNSVLEGPAAGRWATDDLGYVKFLGRYGNADAGITFDSSETTPSTNGNLEVTQSGTYMFHLLMEFSPYSPTWVGTTGFAEGVFSLRYKRGADPFANTGLAGGSWIAEPYISGDVDYFGSASGLFPLEEGDLLHIQLGGGSHSSGDPKTFNLDAFRLTYERVGDYVEVATP
jgi:hypothetical protein